MDTPLPSIAPPATAMARAHSSSSIYQISTLPSQIIMSMGLQQAARPQTTSTAPMIFSHLALDFFGAGERMALPRTCLAPPGSPADPAVLAGPA